jgi:hypothetical protein
MPPPRADLSHDGAVELVIGVLGEVETREVLKVEGLARHLRAAAGECVIV